MQEGIVLFWLILIFQSKLSIKTVKFSHINTFHNLLDIVIHDRGDTVDLLEIPKSTLLLVEYFP